MTSEEHAKWLETATLEEVVMSCIWQSIMEYTAHCGWTIRAREGLVTSVQDHVLWAIRRKTEAAVKAAK